MKRVALWAAVFVAGGLIAFVNDLTLGSLWMSLGWREPVASWLVHSGLSPRPAAYCSVGLTRLPVWVVALLSGIVIGRLATGGRWLPCALSFGAGLVTYPLIATIYWCIPYLDLGATPAIHMFMWMACLPWDLLAGMLVLLMAWLFRRQAGSAAADKPVPAADL